MFYHGGDTSHDLLPDLANGYVGTIAKSDTIHAGGLFNGDGR